MSAWAEDRVELFGSGHFVDSKPPLLALWGKQDPFSSASFEARSAPLPYPTRSQ